MKLRVIYIPWYLSWKGLLGTKRPQTVWFRTRWGIHTFGMRYPIDVVILDEERNVQALKEQLIPQRFFFWNPRYNLVIEAPVGTIQEKKITKGLHIELY